MMKRTVSDKILKYIENLNPCRLPLVTLLFLTLNGSLGFAQGPIIPNRVCQHHFFQQTIPKGPPRTARTIGPNTTLQGPKRDQQDEPLFRTSLADRSQFQNYAQSTDGILGSTYVVKFLIDRTGDQPKIYFFNTPHFKYHYDFALRALKYNGSIEGFNATYEDPSSQRKYVQGSLLISKEQLENSDSPQSLLEFWAGDLIGSEVLSETYRLIKENLGLQTRLLFHPLSEHQKESAQPFTEQVLPSISSEELLEGRDFYALNQGESMGYLRFTSKDELDSGTALFDYSSILIIDDVPNDLGLVGGVITESLQTPLSHVNIKSINRGTPNAFLQEAREKYAHLENKPVHIKVTADGIEITELTQATADQQIFEFWKSRRPVVKEKPQPLYPELWSGELIELENHYKKIPSYEEHRNLIRRVGAKAANLALISYALKRSRSGIQVKSPQGMAHEFQAYKEHLQADNGEIEKKIIATLNFHGLLDNSKFHSIEKVTQAMGTIQTAIRSKKPPKTAVDGILHEIFDNPDSPIHISKGVPRIRLRSSTNAEDLDGFTGAGLYDSYGISLFKKDKNGYYDFSKPKSREKIREKLEEILPLIFSAVWNVRAFMEREWFSINGAQHLDIAMGIAIHRAFPGKDFDGNPGELANGVAITEDPLDESNPYKIFFNSQHLDLAVTNPPTPEEMAEHGLELDDSYRTEQVVINAYPNITGPDSFWNQWVDWGYEVRSRSSVFDGEQVLKDNSKNKTELTEMEVRRLAQAIQEIRSVFSKVYGSSMEEFKLDLEWKLYGSDRQIWIKQARPFN